MRRLALVALALGAALVAVGLLPGERLYDDSSNCGACLLLALLTVGTLLVLLSTRKPRAT